MDNSSELQDLPENGAANQGEIAPVATAVNADGVIDNGYFAGHIAPISIEDEMRASYLEYAMSVIVARALPDARDGLKPVHRRILYAMYSDLGLRANSTYKKSARIVGEVLGKYHPHGDTAVYDAMARMAQDFSLRYPLVDGQGNFGSVDGDSPAAMRYTEAKLAKIAEGLLQDLDMDTVEWGPNFDDSLKEPLVLPALLPNMLVNGTSGIAVGMATNIPPHNLTEVCDAIIYLIDNWQRQDEIGLDELMTFMKGPDFPTGGLILGSEGVRQAFATGRGRVLVRARTRIEEMRNGNFRIIVTEIPYQLNKTTLLERIAELARSGKLDQIRDLRDESDRKGMRVVIELKRGAAPKKELNRLFKYTPLQGTFGVNNLALVNGEPQTLSLRKSLIIHVDHRFEVITRRTQFQLSKARERAHILEGLRIALEFLDEVIATIRASDSTEEARTNLVARFGLSEVQANAILELQLRRLAALERQKIEDEYQDLMARITYLLDLLAHPQKIRDLIRQDLVDLKEKFGDERRTTIVPHASGDFSEEDLIVQENVLISVSASAYIKRTAASAFKAQGRGGRGVKGMATRGEDEVADLRFARTLDHILFFTDKGRVYASRVFELPEGSRTSKGVHIANVLSLQADESVTTMLTVPDFEHSEYITLLTKKGRIKRVAVDAFSNVRTTGVIAMGLDDDDSLNWALSTTGGQDFIIVTKNGKSLRFEEDQVRAMGRTAAGVWAIRLLGDDEVTGFDVVIPGCDMLVVHENGWGKRTPESDYPRKGRYTQGVWATDHTRLAETGPIIAARMVHENDEITVITSGGIMLRVKVSDISQMGRSTRGVRLVNLGNGDTVAALAVLNHEDLDRKVEGEDEAQPDSDGEESPVVEAVEV
ncbi:MAG: DNA gyrase subunit A [Caldilineaceae bacterium]|nr:DNA gyrase subunit A [Caldilineaceae bacterium]MBP9075004.1 DNA gyrase subunit A [Caldilineaceae bacterium]